MANGSYIPVGRTSLVSEGPRPVQIQTEYATVPYPRITTTISDSGQVVHKVEMKLKREISSETEQRRAEAVLARQHAEVLGIIRQQALESTGQPHDAIELMEKDRGATADPIIAPFPGDKRREASPDDDLPLEVRLRRIPGVQHVYQLDNAGNFFGERAEKQFRKEYRRIFRNIVELLEVFATLPDSDFKRECGVYEVEADRLYLLSTGSDIYFVTVEAVDHDTIYERAFKQVLGV